MKRTYNGISIAIIAFIVFFSAAFLSLSTEEKFDSFEDTFIVDVLLRSLGFWLFGFVLLAVLVVINYTLNKGRMDSYINIFAIGAVVNLIFAALGSLLFYMI